MQIQSPGEQNRAVGEQAEMGSFSGKISLFLGKVSSSLLSLSLEGKFLYRCFGGAGTPAPREITPHYKFVDSGEL